MFVVSTILALSRNAILEFYPIKRIVILTIFYLIHMHASSKRKLFWGSIALVIILAILGVYLYARPDASKDLSTSAVSAEDWAKGTPGKPVLIEYSDFQCPACGAYYPIVKQLASEYSSRIQFVYREYPLTEIHDNALSAAYAAEAAGLQGKFWEMHDALFEHQKEWSEVSDPLLMYEQYATTIGLDMNKFKEDRSGSVVKDRVKQSRASGDAAAVRGTPTFFFNGKRLQNPAGLDAFRATLDYYLSQANSSVVTTK